MIFAVPTDTCFGFACNIYDEDGFEQIYKLKKRDKKQLLSIAVEDFRTLEDISVLNENQIKFLKDYKFPFTVVTEVKDNFVYPDFINKKEYKNFAIRVGKLFFTEETAAKLEFPIFLTSANISSENEIYSYIDVKKIFFGQKMVIIERNLDLNKKPSNIFEFIGDTTELHYIRKNY